MNKTKVLSFIGGLVFFSVAATVLIAKNAGLRKELSEQTGQIIETGKSVVGQVQVVIDRVGRITEELQTAKQNNNIEIVDNTALTEGYNALWADTERKNEQYTGKRI